MRLKLFISLLLVLPPFDALSFTIAVVGKTKNDSFYQQSFLGCVAFAKKHSGVNCIYDGSNDYQDVRTQVLVINDLLKKDIDALLVATTDANFLVKGALKQAKQRNIPVITFDSDVLAAHSDYRLAYVGTNNFAFGVALGNAAKAYKSQTPQPVCIQTGHATAPNLNERVEGVRFALSGQRTERLDGSSGWIEHQRCPLFTIGKRDVALKQLVTMISEPLPPIFIAVAGFAQFNSGYSAAIAPFKAAIAEQSITIISADTEQAQLDILKQGLSTVNIGQNPFEMGRKGAELLYHWHISGQKPAQDKYFLDFHYCTADNAAQCVATVLSDNSAVPH